MKETDKKNSRIDLNKLFMDVFGNKIRNPLWLSFFLVFIHSNAETLITLLNFSSTDYNHLLIDNLPKLKSINWSMIGYTLITYASIMLAFTLHSAVNILKKIALAKLGKSEAKARFSIQLEEQGGLEYEELNIEHGNLNIKYDKLIILINDSKRMHSKLNVQVEQFTKIFDENDSFLKINAQSIMAEAKTIALENVQEENRIKTETDFDTKLGGIRKRFTNNTKDKGDDSRTALESIKDTISKIDDLLTVDRS